MSADHGDPRLFFDTMTALRGWADIAGEERPFFDRLLHSRALTGHVVLPAYRSFVARLDAGDVDARWTDFRDGLFHT